MSTTAATLLANKKIELRLLFEEPCTWGLQRN